MAFLIVDSPNSFVIAFLIQTPSFDTEFLAPSAIPTPILLAISAFFNSLASLELNGTLVAAFSSDLSDNLKALKPVPAIVRALKLAARSYSPSSLAFDIPSKPGIALSPRLNPTLAPGNNFPRTNLPRPVPASAAPILPSQLVAPPDPPPSKPRRDPTILSSFSSSLLFEEFLPLPLANIRPFN